MSRLTNTARGFETVVAWVTKLLIWVCAIIVFAMMAIIAIEVTLRYVFRTSLIWSFEVVEYIMVGLSVLGLAYIQSQGKHIKIEFVVDRFKPRAQVATGIFTSIVALFLFVLFTIAGWNIAWEAWTFDIRSWSIFKIPQFPVRVQVLIGSFIMCLYLLVEFSRGIRAFRGKSIKSADKSQLERIGIE